jgi:hypothetical protein
MHYGRIGQKARKRSIMVRAGANRNEAYTDLQPRNRVENSVENAESNNACQAIDEGLYGRGGGGLRSRYPDDVPFLRDGRRKKDGSKREC